jgi:hypothetical protein
VKHATIYEDRAIQSPSVCDRWDWIEACRGGDPHILANFDHGGPLSEVLMLGNIATQFPEETITCNPVAGQIIDHTEAFQQLGFAYRDGWRI